ncbi:Fungalysin/Thermolysin Extracellular metalloproteinase 5 [Tulasnella sp. 427]|nr:Fungalysin/Thermolysin Extracellular metalloproteinase 5 [Tulasnella sp. 427]
MHPKWAKLVPFVAALSAAVEAHSPLRKTVSFGPQLSHSKYTTSPSQLSSFTTASNDKQSVFRLADEYVKDVLGHPEGSWKLREDSYLDENTGVWHLYLRQVMHDGTVEVTDGDINLNVRNGKVISYGDSFYRGPRPSLKDASSTFAGDEQGGLHDLAYYCNQLGAAQLKLWESENPKLAAEQRKAAEAWAKMVDDPKWAESMESPEAISEMFEKALAADEDQEPQYAPEGQLPLAAKPQTSTRQFKVEPIDSVPDWAWSASSKSDNTERIARLYQMTCGNSNQFLDAQFYLNDGENLRELGPVSEAADAALFFILAVHPNEEEAGKILENIPKFRKQISSTFTHHLHGNGAPQVELEGVPATVSPVKATLAYVQTPCEAETAEGTHNGCRSKDQTSVLTLVWKLVVEMQDNWYEAHVDARLPTRVMNVVDWVSDYAPHGERVSKKCFPYADGSDPDDDVAPVPKKPKNADTVYKVWPWGVNDPQEGSRDFIKAPHDETASPLGWHAIPAAHNPQSDSGFPLDGLKSHSAAADEDMCYFTTTWGNNVQAQENWEGRNNWLKNYRPEGNTNLTFVYQYGAGKKHDGDKVDPKSYIDLSVSQMFYTSNMVHDLYYRYGFNEVAGNFQNYNFGKGGKENDGVTANAQDGSGYNNANFATPPDGQRGRMRMYVWDTASPFRDGDLEAGIVIHELSHGLSTRLTGGPANSGCLGWGESGGMGEGWGDFLATVIRSTSKYSDYPMGAWAANRAKGIRNYVYSTNLTTNPSVYKTLDGGGYWGVHAIGEVWAEILFVVLQGVLEKHPYGEDLFPPQPNAQGTYDYPNSFYSAPIAGSNAPIPKHGNTLMVQLVLDAMKLQPCRPSFIQARDAIVQADQNLTGGENFCVLWAGFSSRGLGPFSKLRGGTPWGGGIRFNDFSVPVKCGGTGKPDRGDGGGDDD